MNNICLTHEDSRLSVLSGYNKQPTVIGPGTVGVGPEFEVQAWTKDAEWQRTSELLQRVQVNGQYLLLSGEGAVLLQEEVLILHEEGILFATLVDQWHQERGAISSFSEMILCPSYQRIIGMGAEALPLILAQMRREGNDPDHWSAALEAITGADPVPEEACGDTVKIAEAWFVWAEENDVH